jgi:hypothetical protein
VDFGNVQIREYTQVIGDHPSCSSGCPLSLGWDYIQTEPESLQDYEQHKKEQQQQQQQDQQQQQEQQQDRKKRLDELRLSDEERHERLVANEVSETEIRRVMRRLHRERECSVRCHLKTKAQFFCEY